MTMTVQEIAKALDARFEGDGAIAIARPSEPAAAGPEHLALAMDKRYAPELAQGKARAAVLWDGADRAALGLDAAIYISRPRYAMAGLTKAFDRPRHAPAGVHPTAVIDESAQIAPDASIGAFCVIGPNVRIGPGATIHAHCSIAQDAVAGARLCLHEGVRIGPDVRIGDDVTIQANSVIGADGFSYVTPQPGAIDEVKGQGQITQSYDAQEFTRIYSIGSVVLGDNVEIGAGCAIDRGTIADTEIGSGTKLDNLVQVGHNVKVGRTCLLCGQVGIGGSAIIEDRVVLGGQVGVADHVRIGSNVIAAGKSGISSNVPPNRAIMGNPAIVMEANVASYKAYRRLPRLMEKLEALTKRVTDLEK